MQINILGRHRSRCVLLNIFPLRCWCECGRSAKQSRKSPADGGGGGSNTRRNQRRRWGKGDISSLCCGESLLSLNGSDEGSVDHKAKQSPAADHLFPIQPVAESCNLWGNLGLHLLRKCNLLARMLLEFHPSSAWPLQREGPLGFSVPPVRPSTGQQRVDMLPSWCSPLRGCSSLAFRCVSPTKSSMLV